MRGPPAAWMRSATSRPETARADFRGCRDEAWSLCGFLDARAGPAVVRRVVCASSPARPNSRFSASLYAATVSASEIDLSCSVGLISSFSTMSRVISSTRARASGGSDASFGSSRRSSDCRMDSNRCRSATTVGTAPRELSQPRNLPTSCDDDLLRLGRLGAPLRDVFLHDRLQVVDVVEEHLLELAGARPRRLSARRCR